MVPVLLRQLGNRQLFVVPFFTKVTPIKHNYRLVFQLSANVSSIVNRIIICVNERFVLPMHIIYLGV